MKCQALALPFATLAIAIASAIGAGIGCSSAAKAAPEACTSHAPPAGADFTQPAAHFRADVLPLFVQSCAFTSCHGDRGGGSSGVFLGSKEVAADPGEVRSGLVGVAAPELASMPLVTPSDPARSYVMHKLDGDQCLFDAECADKSCGDSMPQAGETLPAAERDKVRRWIAQGAKDD
jgi:hypothetical protein